MQQEIKQTGDQIQNLTSKAPKLELDFAVFTRFVIPTFCRLVMTRASVQNVAGEYIY